MIRRLLIAALIVLAPATAQAVAPEPLELADGTRYDPDKAYRIPQEAEVGRLAWVPVSGLEFRSKPGRDTPPIRGERKSKFMEPAVVWQVADVNGVKYLLLTTIIEDKLPLTVEVPFGWIPASNVLAYKGLRPPAALPAELKDETGQLVANDAIPQKGFIINTAASIAAAIKAPPPPLFKAPATELKEPLDRGEFPPALRRLFADAGLRLGDNVRVSRRLDGKGWIITEGERLNRGQVFAARQEYDIRLENGEIICREHPNMAWVYDQPKAARANRRKSLVLANIFFIFQKRDGFALIGSRPTIEGQTAEAIYGWVEESRLMFWNTAEALEWDRSTTDPQTKPSRTADGLIFTNKEDAQKWMTLQLKAERTNDFAARDQATELGRKTFLAREPKGPDGRTRPYIGMEMRYPLLQPLSPHPDGATRMYQLGWFGPFVPEGQEKGGQAQERQFAELRAKLLAAIKNIKTVELLFVIDGTPSMYEYRTTVIPEVVAECLKELDRVRQSDDQFADLRVTVRIVLFGQGQNAPIYRTFPPPGAGGGKGPAAEIVSANVPGVDQRIAGLAAWLKEERMLSSLGSNGLKPVFDATLEGLQLAQFGDRTRKYVIVIGNAGDKSGTADPRREPLRELIAQLAPPGATPVTFLGIRAVVRCGAEADNGLLKRQFEAIRDEARRRAAEDAKKNAGPQDSTAMNDETVAEVFDLVGDAVTLRKELATTIRGRFDRLKVDIAQLDTQLREPRQGASTAASPFLQKLLEANNINIQELVAGGVQVYETGYAYDKTPVGKDLVRQLRPVYLMPLSSVRKLRDVLLEITDEGRAVTKDPGDLKKFMIELLMRLINTEDPKDIAGKTVAAEFRRRYGIAIKSGFLKIPVDQIADKITDEDCESLLLIACRLKELLDEEKESDWKIVRERVGVNGVTTIKAVRTPGTERKADRFYEFPGGDRTRWVWLDQEKHVP